MTVFDCGPTGVAGLRTLQATMHNAAGLNARLHLSCFKATYQPCECMPTMSSQRTQCSACCARLLCQQGQHACLRLQLSSESAPCTRGTTVLLDQRVPGTRRFRSIRSSGHPLQQPKALQAASCNSPVAPVRCSLCQPKPLLYLRLLSSCAGTTASMPKQARQTSHQHRQPSPLRAGHKQRFLLLVQPRHLLMQLSQPPLMPCPSRTASSRKAFACRGPDARAPCPRLPSSCGRGSLPLGAQGLLVRGLALLVLLGDDVPQAAVKLWCVWGRGQAGRW